MTEQPTSPAASPDGAPKVSLATIFWIFFQIGSLSFGGGLTAWLYREIVDKRRLMTGQDFMSALTLAQVLPGFNMTNLSVYVGQRLRGVEGACMAMFGLLLVPFFAIVAIGTVYAQLREYTVLHHFLDGVAAVACGLLLTMGLKSVKVTNMERVHLIITAIVAITVGILRWPMVPVILVMAPISVLLAWRMGAETAEDTAKANAKDGPDACEIWTLIIVIMPLSLLSFGGGASILAPLHNAFVEHYRWLTAREYVDYFAISRASPGPGSMLVSLIGWKVAGWGGAFVAMVAIFLPSSLLCFRVARIWNRHRGTPLHRALERGLVPIGTGLMFAGAMITQHTSETGAVGWAVALATVGLLTWKNVHPLVALAGEGS